MMKCPILDGGKRVGEAVMEREGMYSVIRCSCILASGKPQRLSLRAGELVVDLGLCVPEDGAMGLLKRMPSKVLEGKEVTVYVEEAAGKKILFVPGRCFEQIHLLEGARLQICEGKYYVVTS